MNKQFRKTVIWFFLAALLMTAAQPLAAKEQKQTEAVHPRALEILDRASSFLDKQDQFSAKVEIWEDIEMSADTLIQYTETVKIFLRRPDHFRVEVATAVPEKTFFYNGKTVTYLDQIKRCYGSVAVSGGIKKTITEMNIVYGLTFPLDDILLRSPFAGSAPRANAGQYFGVELISGIPCHHLAFQHDRIDWQVWIQDGALPVFRKLVMNHKTQEGSPRFIAQFHSWDFTTELPDYLFTIEPSPDYFKINFMKTSKDNTPKKQ